MPIRAENKPLYPSDWKAIRAEILERDGNKCKICGVDNHAVIDRSKDMATYMYFVGGEVKDAETGEHLGYARGSEWPTCGRITRVILTIAHLDHDPTNNGEPGNRPNLAALCQMHHLRHDAEHHKVNAAQTRRAKLGNMELFDSLPNPPQG